MSSTWPMEGGAYKAHWKCQAVSHVFPPAFHLQGRGMAAIRDRFMMFRAAHL